jgi:hypothetical protein
MTNKANKFGLRAAAAERTRKHAQRTPLPPRPGQIEAACVVLDSLTAVQSSVVDGDGPSVASWGKAKTFAEKAATAGWETATEARGDAVELTARRGPETIVQSWLNGVWQYDASVYAFADRTTKPRNASGAAKLLGRTPEDASKEMQRVASNKSFRKREPVDLAPIALPLDADLLTDEEAAKFFRGHTVRWYNRLSRGTEVAMVSRTSDVHVTRWEGETIINFCCPVTGFRSFRLSTVLGVSGGRAADVEKELAVAA